MFVFLRKKENVFRVLLCLYFGYLLLSRVIYLNADSPAFWLDVEEKSTAYNARNAVLFGEWLSGGVNFDATVVSPLPGIISYLSFLFFGVSLFTLRLPYALLSVLAIFIFYKILKKEMNPWVALLGSALIGSVHFMFLVNRSALIENLFILLTAVSLYLYQDYEENERDESLFLFGLFSALNISVKYSAIYFLVVSAVGAVMIIFRSGRSYQARRRACLYYAAGVVLSLVLPVLAFYYGQANGALETIRQQCANQIGAAHYFLLNIRFEYPFFFMTYFPFISLAALTGLFSMLVLHFKKLNRTDFFVVLWLILGSLLAFSNLIGYKRLIFLIIPLMYVAVKGGYLLGLHLKELSGMGERGRGSSSDLRSGAVPLALKGVAGFLFVMMISWVTKQAFCEHRATEHISVWPLPVLFPISADHAGLISVIIMLLLMLVPVVGALSSFFKTRSLDPALTALKGWFAAALFLYLVMASAVSIVTNELRNGAFLFLHKNLKFQSFEYSRDLGRTLKPGVTIIGSEMALRLLGFENRCKFIFNHDGVNNSGKDPYALDVNDIIARKEIPYFCLFLSDSASFQKYFEPGFERIKMAGVGFVFLKNYEFADTYPSVIPGPENKMMPSLTSYFALYEKNSFRGS